MLIAKIVLQENEGSNYAYLPSLPILLGKGHCRWRQQKPILTFPNSQFGGGGLKSPMLRTLSAVRLAASNTCSPRRFLVA
jgi:hypothetical protein